MSQHHKVTLSMQAPNLWEILVSSSPPGARAHLLDRSRLEPVLLKHVKAAREKWSTLKLPDAVFVRHLGERLPEGPMAAAALINVGAVDLFLACACARGIAGALVQLDREYLSQLKDVLARTLGAQGALIDDVQQVLREKLLIAREGKAARILSYTGQGSLDGWLKSAAIRTAINLRPTLQTEAFETAMGERAAPEEDPELKLLKARCRKEFKEAFESALAQSPAEDLDWLRKNLVDGMSIDRLAELYGISRATAARRVAAARKALMERTRERLVKRLRLSSREVKSIVGLLRSQLDLSLHSRLGVGG